ncbi:methyltransferase domain-containing protein [Paenibacillus polysaccharolyticus]|uniref:class I SAM-dependent methyltransferase n=1 Tax=Paenibacillus polysaccharolyticus TaxID=582692 RepID=UPI00203FD6EA|nr:class I SAM-dependent methyltransferase [Paenibacillus polysaccharolyticus]MCM3133507.1 methyltransferase domain-containing protein [Paenibacillus polysaccharolyticus]
MGKLLELAKIPEPFEEGSVQVWLDESRVDQVLKAHFDENIPGGSKSSEFINETIDFIHTIAPLDQHKKVVDLGCGPGLYAQKLAKKGYEVVGVDFNPKSIEYARQEAAKEDLSIEYRNEDMTSIELESEFDVALLIYEIYSVFSPENRKKILNNIHRGLKPGGLVLLDVLSEHSYEKFETQFMWGLTRKDNPFSPKKHLSLYASVKYPDYVTLSKNLLVFDDGELVNYHYWNQHFTIESLQKEVNDSGFTIEKVYADVNGAEYQSDLDTFAVILKKK